MTLPIHIVAEFIESNTSFVELIERLKEAFSSNNIIVPQRHHHDFPNSKSETDTTLLLMPAWNPGKESGVKVVTVNPNNTDIGMPAIQGSYLYMDAETGQLKAIIEAKSLTAKRTAAASALASSLLSREDANSLLMLGTGALSINLIKAHASVRPINKVYVWGRNFEKARAIANQLKDEAFAVEPIEDYVSKLSQVAIVSCATLSKDPLVFGAHLVDGQHIDLVGAYKPNMRESDDEAIRKSMVYIDTFSGINESGDMAIPIEKGLLKEKDIKADLFGLCLGQKKGRKNAAEITLFKSVGHALEDLVAAKYYYQKYTHGQDI